MATFVPSGPGTRHERESLSDFIALIDPYETPVYNDLTTKTTPATRHDWTYQDLTASSGDNFQAYGADSSDSDGLAPTRLDNYIGETTKDGKVADIYDNINTAGGENETERQEMLKALELRRDCEAALTANTAKSGGGVPRPGGMPTYILNNSLGATGADPTGDGSDAATPGTARDLDKIAYIDEALLKARKAGGKPRYMYMSPDLNQDFSDIPDANAAGAASLNQINQTNTQPLTSVGAVSGYLSDFGLLEVVPSDHMFGNTIIGVDPNYAAKGFTNGGEMYRKDLGDVGTSKRFVIASQITLEMSANAHFCVHALNE